jgi:hypothetical protein
MKIVAKEIEKDGLHLGTADVGQHEEPPWGLFNHKTCMFVLKLCSTANNQKIYLDSLVMYAWIVCLLCHETTIPISETQIGQRLT